LRLRPENKHYVDIMRCIISLNDIDLIYKVLDAVDPNSTEGTEVIASLRFNETISTEMIRNRIGHKIGSNNNALKEWI